MTTISGSGSLQERRASRPSASSRLSAASARTAARRTSPSLSLSDRSTPRSQWALRSLAGRGRDLQRPGAHLRRLVMQQQRRHEVALVERLEQIDGVDDPPRIGVRQLGDQRFDGVEVGGVEANLRRLHVLLLDAAAERGDVLALGHAPP